MMRLFISSVQKDLAEERQALKDYIEGDTLLRRFFEVFLFEKLPASDRRANDVYLDEVDRCDLYIGALLPNTWGVVIKVDIMQPFGKQVLCQQVLAGRRETHDVRAQYSTVFSVCTHESH